MRGFKIFSLTDNGEAVTAVANDSGYEHVFAHQLDCVLEPGDLVVAMSVSGNSPNIVNGLEVARQRGARTVALCGFDGGKVRSLADIVVHAPTTKDEYGPAEDIFSVICHIVSGYLTMRRGRPLHH
jgi:phosphoheptose isomerase